jgi:hypothetical protein
MTCGINTKRIMTRIMGVGATITAGIMAIIVSTTVRLTNAGENK